MSYFIVYDKNLKTHFGYFKSLIDLDIWQKRNCIQSCDVEIHEIVDKHKYRRHLYHLDCLKNMILEKKLNELTLADEKNSENDSLKNEKDLA